MADLSSIASCNSWEQLIAELRKESVLQEVQKFEEGLPFTDESTGITFEKFKEHHKNDAFNLIAKVMTTRNPPAVFQNITIEEWFYARLERLHHIDYVPHSIVALQEDTVVGAFINTDYSNMKLLPLDGDQSIIRKFKNIGTIVRAAREVELEAQGKVYYAFMDCVDGQQAGKGIGSKSTAIRIAVAYYLGYDCFGRDATGEISARCSSKFLHTTKAIPYENFEIEGEFPFRGLEGGVKSQHRMLRN